MASFDFGIKISAQDSASGIISSIQQKITGMSSSVGAAVASAGQRMATFGMATMGVQQITGALAGVADQFTKYEADVAAVGAITGLAGKELDNIGNSARNLAKDFGGSASDQLKSFQGVLSKFGADQFKDAAGAASLTTITKNINTLSAASGDSAAQSMDVLANAMLQMGVNTDDAAIAAKTSTEYINTLAASAQVGSAEIPQVGAAFLQVGVAAKGLNMDFNEVNTAIQVIGKGGKYGAEAGVALRNMLGLMMTASKPGEAAMAKLGTSSKELGAMIADPSKGLNFALKKMKEGLAKIPDDAEKATIMSAIFGKETAATALSMVSNTESYDNFRTAIKKSADEGAAFSQAQVRMATASTMASRAQSYVNDMFLEAGKSIGKYGIAAISTLNSVAPQLTALAGIKTLIPPGAFGAIASGAKSGFTALSGVAKNSFGAIQSGMGSMIAGMRGFSFSGVFSSLASGASSAVSSMGSALSGGVSSLRNFAAQQLLAARGSALFSGGIGGFARTIGGSLVGGVRSAISSVMAMNMAFLTSPVTWIVLGIAAAAFLIYKNWAPIKQFFGGLFDGIAGFFSGFMDGISAAFSAPWSILQEVFAAFAPIIDAVKALFAPVQGVAGATGAAANNFAWLKDAGIVAGQYIGTAFRVVVTPILFVIKVVAQVIGMLTGLTHSGGNMAKVLIGAFTAITIPIQIVMTLIGGLFTFIQSLFSGASLQEAGMNMITSLWTGIQAMWGKLVDGVKGLVGGITNLFSGKKDEATKTTADLKEAAAKPAEVAKPKEPEIPKIKAPEVGKPKIPKPDAPKLRPLNPPEAPDFSWIAKQKAEPPKINKFPPIEPPQIGGKAGAGKPIELGLPEALKSVSTEGTKILSENSAAFKLPELQLPKLDSLKDFKLPEIGLPKLEDVVPGLQLPDFTKGLPKVQLPDVQVPKFETPGLDSILKTLGIEKPTLPPITLPEAQDVPVAGKPIPIVGTPAKSGASGGVTVNFSVNLNMNATGANGAPATATDIAEQVSAALRKLAPDLAREVQNAMEQDKRLQFAGF